MSGGVMSVEMFCPHAPSKQETYECQCVDCTEGDGPLDDCGQCDGEGEWSVTLISDPHDRISNGNAHAILPELGLDPVHGEVGGDELRRLHSRVSMAAHNPELREGMHRQSFEDTGSGDADVVDPGLDDGRVVEHLEAIREVCEYAMEHDSVVKWY